MTEEEYWYWLFNINGIWNKKISKLLNGFDNPKNIFNADANMLKKVDGISEKDICNIIESKENLKKINELNNLDKKNIKFTYKGHSSYPEKLYNIYDAPNMLLFRGNLPDEKRPAVAIVGTRACTNYGYSIAQNVAKELSINGVQIISGMAKGIDGSAHRGAMQAGAATYAVLGCGVDNCYPRENIDIFTECIRNGGIISEYPLGTKPSPWQFPMRNRIISGLADIIIVIEARERSGSLITAECAIEQGKDVYAVPGRITDPLSAGCNRLIKCGAGVLCDTKDILKEFEFKMPEQQSFLTKNKITLEKDLQVVYSCLDLLPKSLDTIVEETGQNASEIMQAIVRLQLMDMVCEPIKNYYAAKL